MVISIINIYNYNLVKRRKYQMNTKTGQESSSVYSATMVEGKLYLEINDNSTYKGILEASPFYDLKEVKECFQSGEMKVITKTTSKICLKFGPLKIQLQSQMSYQLDELKKQNQELEAKVKKLEQKLSNVWEEEDLNSTTKFDLGYIYYITTNAAHTLTTVDVTESTLIFFYGASCTTSSTNRRANSTGWVVTKMMKRKI